MSTVISILGCIVVAMASTAISHACPQQCDCRKHPTSGMLVECQDQQFLSIPRDFPSDTVEIIFSKSNLPDLKSTTLPKLEQLLNLTFESCIIDEINTQVFGKFPKLEVLTLVSNQMFALHKHAFKDLKSLKHLYFQENRLLYEIPDLEFTNLNIVDLDLNGNQFHDFYETTFVGSGVENLNLDDNSLNNINKEDIEPLKTSLKTLSIKNNKRMLGLDTHLFEGFSLESIMLTNSQISEHTFLGFLTTKVLDISSNPFKDLQFSSYTNLKSVTELSANNLRMDFMEDYTFSPFTNLLTLSIAQNNIILVSPGVFRYMPHLTSLNMGSNSFILLPDDFGKYLTNLETLQMARCHLVTLKASSFQGMKDLTVLDVRYNKLQVVDAAMSTVLDNIAVLGLQGNPLHCNCEMKWYRQWIQDKGLDQGNHQCFSPRKADIMDIGLDEFQCFPPVITRIQGLVEALVGEDVHLTCVAYGDPAPDVEWVPPSGGIMKVSASYNKTMLHTTGVITLQNVDSDRAGEYLCRAYNSLASVNATTLVTIIASRSVTSSSTVVTSSSTVVTSSTTVMTSLPFKEYMSTSEPIEFNSSTSEWQASVDSAVTYLSNTTLNAMNYSTTPPYHKELLEYKYIIIAVVLSVFSILCIGLTLAFFFVKKKKKKYDVREGESASGLTSDIKPIEVKDMKNMKCDEKQKLTTEL